jgi:LemA protein
MKIALVIIAILVLLGLGVGSKMASVNNQLVVEREAIAASWAQVDNVLQRRSDLIPNLVETVKGFAAQEKEVFGAIASARAAMIGARTPQEKIQASGQLESALGRLMVVVENYPALRSSENFMRLQDELAGTENRIAVERGRYNKAVETYNKTIGVFPNNLFAGILGFQRNDDYFRADPGARTAPAVKFGGSEK